MCKSLNTDKGILIENVKQKTNLNGILISKKV